MSSSNSIRWGGTAGIVGGLLWALLPLSMTLVSLEDTQPGTLAHLATVVSYWLMSVLPLLLLVVGQVGLRTLYGGDYGRLGTVGFFVSSVALALMFAGNGVEVASPARPGWAAKRHGNQTCNRSHAIPSSRRKIMHLGDTRTLGRG